MVEEGRCMFKEGGPPGGLRGYEIPLMETGVLLGKFFEIQVQKKLFRLF